ncbi:MAG: cold shock domain-containing protein [Phycisphaerae bacterium]|nr:cold shock domain-containing protein [Phycisphaerae bacterium]
MARGTVKWFDPKKGFGFVVNENGVDVFVHYTNIEGEGFRCLKSGQDVVYQEKASAKGLQGLAVKILSVDNDCIASDDEQELESAQY